MQITVQENESRDPQTHISNTSTLAILFSLQQQQVYIGLQF